jgi:hypothetical protein
VYAVKVVKVKDISNDPDLVAIQKHDFSSTFIGIVEIRLAVELVCICDAWSQIRR